MLTSGRTFSGGEDFGYTLQALGPRGWWSASRPEAGRTRPGAFPISAAVHIAIPFARSVNPVTGTNWEGTGVMPDMAVAGRRGLRRGLRQGAGEGAGDRTTAAAHRGEAREALARLQAAG